MIGDDQLCAADRMDVTAQRIERILASQHVCGGGGAEGHDHLGANDVNLAK